MNIKNEMLDHLFQAVLTLNNVEECYKFFEDICTYKELEAFAQRLEVAKMLRDKQVYTDIVAQTGASTATISRVNRALKYGEGGYAIALDRLNKQ